MLSDYGLRRAREFTWAATAMETWAALEDLRRTAHTTRPAARRRDRSAARASRS